MGEGRKIKVTVMNMWTLILMLSFNLHMITETGREG